MPNSKTKIAFLVFLDKLHEDSRLTATPREDASSYWTAYSLFHFQQVEPEH